MLQNQNQYKMDHKRKSLEPTGEEAPLDSDTSNDMNAEASERLKEDAHEVRCTLTLMEEIICLLFFLEDESDKNLVYQCEKYYD